MNGKPPAVDDGPESRRRGPSTRGPVPRFLACVGAAGGFLASVMLFGGLSDEVSRRTNSSFAGICGPHGDSRWITVQLVLLACGPIIGAIVGILSWRWVQRRAGLRP
ncbi:MAG: hypothetical protein HY292_28085 [Planctomycetes bacterium]|nr:hypothetical protein [Planctomycetota bacterium]